MTDGSLLGYDVRWLCLAVVPLLLAFHVAVSRQVLAVFSRRLLLANVSEARRAELETYLDNETEYTASLRALDLFLRLMLILSLAFGRWMVLARIVADLTFFTVAADCVLLAVEIILLIAIVLEILPAIVARLHPESILARRLRTMDLVHQVVGPIRLISGGTVKRVVRLLGGSAERASADILEEDILTAAEGGERDGLLESRDIDMIESIIGFGNVEVSQVMTPRTEVICFDLDDPLEVNIQRAVECGHSRIPIYRDSKDKIVGILYVKDFLRYWDRKGSISLDHLARKPHFVPLTKKIGELFQEFRTQRFHIAIVLDEFGGTAGLITIEDIIEEIVGEIIDEHEKIDRPPLRRLGPGLVEVDGTYHIDDLNAALGTSIPESDAYDTIGGFLSFRMAKIPGAGETHEFDTLKFEVTLADDRRVRRLRIHFPGEEFRPAESMPDRVRSQR